MFKVPVRKHIFLPLSKITGYPLPMTTSHSSNAPWMISHSARRILVVDINQ